MLHRREWLCHRAQPLAAAAARRGPSPCFPRPRRRAHRDRVLLLVVVQPCPAAGWPCRRRKPRAAAHHGGRRGKDGGGAPRQGWWRGAAASAEAGRRGEDGGGAPRRARSPGAAARMGAGCHGECGGGARRRVRRRSAAAARAKAEHSGELVAGRGTSGASAGREGGWEPSAQGERMGGRERKGWREEGEMHER